MRKNKKIYPNPKFRNYEEEEKYWMEHSPLDEGYEGVVSKGNKKIISIFRITKEK